MPQLQSSKKRLRQTVVRTERNRARRKTMKLAARAALEAARAGDQEGLKEAIAAAQKAFDKAAKVGAIHKGKAARRKSRLMKQIVKLSAAE